MFLPQLTFCKIVGLPKKEKEVGRNGYHNICGAFDKFPDFFVQAFKIALDS